MSRKVLVLNQDYQAISVCSVERAFILLYLQKAEMLSEVPALALNSINHSFKFPSIIRLFRYINLPYRRVNLSRYNVFRRDDNKCVYCGSNQNLTIDHLIPKSQNGKDSWENLVTACQKCNSKKGDLSLEQAGMELSHQPFRPSFVMFLSKFSGSVRDDWKPYLYMA